MEDLTDKNSSLLNHLSDFRNCLLKSLSSIILVFLFLIFFANDIYEFFAKPIQSILPIDGGMIATEIASTFLAPFKLTLFLSVILSMPYTLFQLWSFVAPGLYKKEKKIVIPIFFSSIIFFYLGMIFCYLIVFPIIFGFFSSVAPIGISVTPDISHYLNFILKLFIAFGITFEIPIAILILVITNVTTIVSLKKKRPYIIISCFIFGMLLTPPDIISQSLLAIPAWLLFEFGLILSIIFKRNTIENANR